MTKLIAGIIAYNEEYLLPCCLDSIVDKVDNIVLVDGRIDAFPGDGYKSTDNTVAIARDYGCRVIEPTRAWRDEQEMRSQYLVGDDGDWYVFIDADERCMTPLPCPEDFPEAVDAFSVLVKMIGDNTGKFRPRLFRHKGVMEYRGVHDALFSDGKLISNPNEVIKLHSVWFAHMQMRRDSDRRRSKHEYYKEGYKHESVIRHEWGMTNHD
jgi:glycosyltransferase involved in cell wall biosynthesis